MIKLPVSIFKNKLIALKLAYNRVFDRENIYTKDVLLDLAKFCRAHESTFHVDPRMHAVLEGRREVWLKIQEYLQLDMEEIYQLHKIKEIKPSQGE